MKYEKPIMDIIFFNEICIITTSFIQDGVFGEIDKDHEDILGDEFQK